MPRLTRTEQYMWCTMARKGVDTFVVLAIPFFAENDIEGAEEFIDTARRLKIYLNNPELENKTLKVIAAESRKMATNATNSLPEGKGKLTASDCHSGFLRFLFLADLLLMQARYGCPAFTSSPDWQTVQQWIRGAVKLFESKAGTEPLPEETWADKQFKHYCTALRK